MLIGMEPKERIDLLLSLASIRSDSIKEALTLHFVQGFSCNLSATYAEVTTSNLQRAIKKIEGIDRIVRDIEDIDFAVSNQKRDK